MLSEELGTTEEYPGIKLFSVTAKDADRFRVLAILEAVLLPRVKVENSGWMEA